jgi:hypothetical protein
MLCRRFVQQINHIGRGSTSVKITNVKLCICILQFGYRVIECSNNLYLPRVLISLTAGAKVVQGMYNYCMYKMD